MLPLFVLLVEESVEEDDTFAEVKLLKGGWTLTCDETDEKEVSP